ncbi:MAG TPA: hypothetical protein VET65_12905 [Candidatus Limnocylindrales bacterium]|nr:hypothetical protein [Candidatus Limnocylindrales bacterium]
MAVSQGALARTSAEIRRARMRPHDTMRQRARLAVRLADDLLDDLELLLLSDRTEVPPSLLESADAVASAAQDAGVRAPRLRAEDGILMLMEDVYQLEERLLRRSRLRAIAGALD